jgi:hypothetical protein
MRKTVVALASAVVLTISTASLAQEEACPPQYGACLTEEQRERILMAVEELDSIHGAPMTMEFRDPIVIVRDWQDRVYVNGGEGKPIRVRVTVGETVERDMEVVLPVKTFFRPAPPEPWFEFRTRFRASAAVLVPEMARSAADGSLETFWDFGLDLDFLKVGDFNGAVHVGSAGAGVGPGFDVTKNFGVAAMGLVTWETWRPSASAVLYLSFN